jgi:GTP cyclohydrolase II
MLPAIIQIPPRLKTPELRKTDIKKTKAKLILTAKAPLNLRDCGKAEIYAYRAEGKMSEHLALVIGKPGKKPLVRVHSCCYTGDLLGSLSCDCRDQLRGAIQLMEKSGGGILVYLMQEGRGIGLINKLRAYELQSNGMDTVEANEFLGFDDEERAFTPAAAILKELGVKNISLISNNPKKAHELEVEGIKVSKLVPMIIEHEHNRHYLGTKQAKSGHIINK